MLKLSGITKQFRRADGSVRALDGVSLRVEAGEMAVIRGPSGCGKTSLLLVAGGLLLPDAGDVAVGGEDLYALSPNRRAAGRARRIGFVFQQFHLIPYLSALDNVRTAAIATSRAVPGSRAADLLAAFGLQDRLHHLPAELSTGEQQRTALARALLNEPGLLLADEPTGNLDPHNSTAILQQLHAFSRSGGAVLVATHDVGAAAFADRLVEMDGGRLT